MKKEGELCFTVCLICDLMQRESAVFFRNCVASDKAHSGVKIMSIETSVRFIGFHKLSVKLFSGFFCRLQPLGEWK